MQYLINNFQNKLKQTPNSSMESNFAYSWLFYNKSNSCSVIRVLFSAWSVSQFLPQFIILNLEFKQQESDTEQAPELDPALMCSRCQNLANGQQHRASSQGWR